MQEISVLEQVELRFLTANTGEKFSKCLDTFFVPLIQKLDTNNPDVATKATSVLELILQKVTDSPEIILPITKILDFYENLWANLGTAAIAQLDTLQRVIYLILQTKRAEIKPDYFIKNAQNVINPELKQYFNQMSEHFSLLLYKLTSSGVSIDSCDELDVKTLQMKFAEIFLLNLTQYRPESHPLLSKHSIEFFTKSGEKVGIAYPLTDGKLFTDLRKKVLSIIRQMPKVFAMCLLAASGDSITDIRNEAHTQLKKLQDFDITVVKSWVLKGNTHLQIECAEILAKQQVKVEPELIAQLFRNPEQKLRQHALSMLEKMQEYPEWNSQTNTEFAHLLHQYLIDEGWPRAPSHSNALSAIRMKCYELIGIFENSESAVSFLFQSLERDLPQFSPGIQKGLSHLLEKPNTSVNVEKMLYYMLKSTNSRVRYAAVKFSISKEHTDPTIPKLICLLGVDPTSNGSDVSLEASRGLLTSDVSQLPPFDELFSRVVDNFALGFTSKATLNHTILFLWCCLNKIPINSVDWTTELLSSMESTFNPQFNTSQFEVFLIQLIFNPALEYSEPVAAALQVLLSHKSDFSNLTSVIPSNRVLELLKSDGDYSLFVAENFPLFMEFDSSDSEKELLASAVFAVINNSSIANILPQAKQTNNWLALQTLSVFHNVELDDLSKLKAKPFLLACLSVHSQLTTRKEILEILLSRDTASFDDLILNGDAISIVCSGWQSKALQLRYPQFTKFCNTEVGENWDLVKSSLESIAKGIKGSPQSRKVSSVRLLCLVQNSLPNLSEKHDVAVGIQQCFMSLLADSDDVTQECAGKGLSILFEKTEQNEVLKAELLEKLVTSFTDSKEAKKNTSGNLTQDTQVFQPGELPAAPDGDKSISTYKDVLNLANETGDSTLVYKFMALSSSSQIWNGRKGIAFSLQQILAKSDLQTQILNGSTLGRNLVPKLFRYLYDPNELTQNAMKQIWTSFIPSNQRMTVIKLYLPLISDELNAGIIDQEWRVRQASASALADLVSQSLLPPSLELWKLGFRLVDDIKDSVREAGSEVLKILTNTMIRQASSGSRTDLGQTVPFLLSGMNNESTRQFSLESLIKLSETQAFKPHAVEVMTELILQLSSLEPQAFNYLALNTSQTLVDEARIKGLRDSPIMQTAESMLERGMPSISEMWQILPNLVQKAVGIPSKLATSKLIVLTCSHTYGSEKHASESLVSKMVAQLWSNNEAIAHSYASSVGYLSRQIPLNLLNNIMVKLWEKFITSDLDDKVVRSIIGETLNSISINSSDAFSAVSKSAIPIIFIGQFSDKPKFYKQAWESNTGGSGSLRLYRSDIINSCMTLFTKCDSRFMKVTAAKALSGALKNAQTNENFSVFEYLDVLLQQLATRSWPGKEHIFKAFVDLAVISTDLSPDLTQRVTDRVINEIKRKNQDYKQQIIQPVVEFYEVNHTPELETELFIAISKSENEDESDQEEQNDSESLAISELTLDNFEKVLGVISDEHVLQILNQTDLTNWKYALRAAKAIGRRTYNPEIWSLVAKHCLEPSQNITVRLELVKASRKFKMEPLVKNALTAHKQAEKSYEIISEINKLIS